MLKIGLSVPGNSSDIRNRTEEPNRKIIGSSVMFGSVQNRQPYSPTDNPSLTSVTVKNRLARLPEKLKL